MRTPEGPQSAGAEPLPAALLAYARQPGKYSARQRQPALLFACVREVVQLAIGREAVVCATDSERVAVQRAAAFFLRTALFYPGADHYALLGLDPSADDNALKDRYRLLMRLIHPDFSTAGSAHWSSEAAVRVNLAYDVLSSATRRRDYDAELAKAKLQPPFSASRRTLPQESSRTGRGTGGRHGYIPIAAFGITGSLVLVSLFVSGRDGVELIQRDVPAHPASIDVAQKTPAPVAPPSAAPLLMADNPAPAPTLLAARLDAAPAALAHTAKSPAAPPAPPTPPARLLQQSLVTAAPARTNPPAPVIVAGYEPPAPLQPAPVIAVSAPIAPPAPAPAPPPPRPAPAAPASPNLAEAQPLLATLLQHLESGRGDRLINMLDREARNQLGAQALLRNYENLVGGMRPVRLSHVDFSAQPADGRLLVTGNIGLHLGDQAVSRKMVLRAEFASRDGGIVLVGLSGGQGN